MSAPSRHGSDSRRAQCEGAHVRWLGVAFATLLAVGSVQAQSVAQLASNVCDVCHGHDGNSPHALTPSLAGQIAPYIERQLHAFAAQGQQRANGIMGAIAVHLSAAEMKRIAAYYARLPLRPAPFSDLAASAAGAAIYFDGIPEKGVASCASCHGVLAEGAADAYPRLAGQHAAYLAEQLRQFRSLRRTTDPGRVMRRAAAGMSNQDIEAVALFSSRLSLAQEPQ